jgi:hypothetical protein
MEGACVTSGSGDAGEHCYLAAEVAAQPCGTAYGAEARTITISGWAYPSVPVGRAAAPDCPAGLLRSWLIRPAEVIEIDGADHGMFVPGRLAASAAALAVAAQ